MPKPCGLDVLAISFLSMVAITAARGVDTAPPETIPLNQGRIYAVPSVQLWAEIEAVLKEYKFKFEELDAANGVAITRWRRPSKRFKGMEFRNLPDGAAPRQFQLHVFVPPLAEPGRLYLGSKVESNTGTDRRFISFNTGDVEAWLYETLESRLGTAGLAIPKEVGPRYALARELLGVETETACLEEASMQLGGVGDVTNPMLILSAKVDPQYPDSGRAAGEQARVILQAIVQEDGFVSAVEVVRNSSPNSKFAVSAARTVSLWRYRPAMKNGCTVPVYFVVLVEFKLG